MNCILCVWSIKIIHKTPKVFQIIQTNIYLDVWGDRQRTGVKVTDVQREARSRETEKFLLTSWTWPCGEFFVCSAVRQTQGCISSSDVVGLNAVLPANSSEPGTKTVFNFQILNNFFAQKLKKVWKIALKNNILTCIFFFNILLKKKLKEQKNGPDTKKVIDYFLDTKWDT